MERSEQTHEREIRARQHLLARVLSDPAFEARVRAEPDAVADALGVPRAWVHWVASLEPRRVEAFRRSRAHKEAVRAGLAPRRV